MASLAAVATFIAGVLSAAISQLFSDEMRAWVPWIVKRLIRIAIKRLPESQRARFTEEWQSHLNDVPGELSKLLLAANFLNAARKMSSIETEMADINPLHSVLKRSLDVIVSVTNLTLLMPLFPVVVLLIKIDSGCPTIDLREKVGLDGRRFSVYAFRTSGNEPYSHRETVIGRLLQKYSIDELPVFLNILRGDMSIVGPKPRSPQYVEIAAKLVPDYAARNRVKPGLIGLALVNCHSNPHLEHADDLYYINNRSLKLDAIIALRMMSRGLWAIMQSPSR